MLPYVTTVLDTLDRGRRCSMQKLRRVESYPLSNAAHHQIIFGPNVFIRPSPVAGGSMAIRGDDEMYLSS